MHSSVTSTQVSVRSVSQLRCFGCGCAALGALCPTAFSELNRFQTVVASVSEWKFGKPLAHARGYRNAPKRAAIGLTPMIQRIWTTFRGWSALTSTRLNRLGLPAVAGSSGSTCGNAEVARSGIQGSITLPPAAAAPLCAGLAFGMMRRIIAAVARPAGRAALVTAGFALLLAADAEALASGVLRLAGARA